MTYVDITASLVDSAGTCLWRGVSRSRVQAAEPHHAAPAPAPAQGMRVDMARAPAAAGGSTSGSAAGSGGGGSSGSSQTATTDYTKPQVVREDEKTTYVVPLDEGNEEASAMFRAAVDSMFTVRARKFPGASSGAKER